jgi:hypothetical protein
MNDWEKAKHRLLVENQPHDRTISKNDSSEKSVGEFRLGQLAK